MAARNVDKTVVPSGATFSANRAIGRRDAASGWREAKMFVDGQVVTGTGAGICQCSTTIYNAALLAGLPIVERHQHTFRVMYAPASRDAAIAWGHKDFKFRNTTSGPILVRTWVRGGKFHAQLWGAAPSGVKAEVSSRVVSRKGGTRSEAYRIVTLPDGTARASDSRATSIARIRKRCGVQRRRLLSKMLKAVTPGLR
jgi:vancomycin resistance protein YoaR